MERSLLIIDSIVYRSFWMDLESFLQLLLLAFVLVMVLVLMLVVVMLMIMAMIMIFKRLLLKRNRALPQTPDHYR